jgi:hypothetical protein
VTRAAATVQLGHLITVAAFTGLRQGELLALRWRQLAFLVSRKVPGRR